MQTWQAGQLEDGVTDVPLLLWTRVLCRPILARVAFIYEAFTHAIARALYSCRPALRPPMRQAAPSADRLSPDQQAAVSKAIIDSLHTGLLRIEKLPGR
jgi:hypothetical protein